MKVNKTIIAVTLVIATALAVVTGMATYRLTTLYRNIEPDMGGLSAGDCSLRFGTYIGYSVEYYWDDESEQMTEGGKTELILKLNPDNTYELSGETHKFTVVGSEIIVPEFGNTAMFRIVGDNRLELLAGAGVEFSYLGE